MTQMVVGAATTHWDEWVALGTLALAGVTVVLAIVSAVGVWVQVRTASETRRLVESAEREVEAVSAQAEATRDQAEATREQAEVARRQAEVAQAALDASVQPMLGPVRIEDYDDDDPERDRGGDVRWKHAQPDYVLISVPLRNVGAGVALITRARISDGEKKEFEHSQEISQTAIPVGETTRVFFALRVPEHNQILRDEVQLVTVEYSDVSGRQRFVSVAAVREVSHNDPQVVRVGVYRAGEEDPFVTIGPLFRSY